MSIVANPPNATVCAGQSVTLTAVGSGGTGSYTFQWSNGATTSAITVLSGGLYSVTMTDSQACISDFSQLVTVNPLPSPTISGATCCHVNTSNHVYSVAASGNSYNWSVSGGLIVSGQGTTSITVTWTVAGTGVVSIIETNPTTSCSKNSNLNVTVTNVDYSYSQIGGSCDGKFQFSTTTPAQTPGMTYAWKSNNIPIGSTRDLVYQFNAYGTGTSSYQVKLIVTYPTGCKDSTTKTINVQNRPDASITDIAGTWKHCVTGSNITCTLIINNTSSTIPTNTHYHIDWGD